MPDRSRNRSKPMNRLPLTRSKIMSRIRGRDTAPELRVRKIVRDSGVRYRVGLASVPGKPDLVFSSCRKAIFVHGCFWHGHPCRSGYRKPKTNAQFWEEKIGANKIRDRRILGRLRRDNWKVLVIWACQITPEPILRTKLLRFLNAPNQAGKEIAGTMRSKTSVSSHLP